MPLKLGISEPAIPSGYANSESLAESLRRALFLAVHANLNRFNACVRVVEHVFLLGVAGLLGLDFWCC